MHTHDLTEDPARAHAAPRHDDGGSATPTAADGPVARLQSLQRTAGNAAVTAALQREEDGTSPVLGVVGRGGGRPLPSALQRDMEARLGAGFSDVRVHDDSSARDSAAAVGARAYTTGHEVVLGEGVDLGSADGQKTLAHELTHVVQQRSGPVEGTDSGGGVSISDPGDRFEREAAANAERVMAAPAPAEAVQREAEDEHVGHDHAVQTEALVQREPAPEEELDPTAPMTAPEELEGEAL